MLRKPNKILKLYHSGERKRDLRAVLDEHYGRFETGSFAALKINFAYFKRRSQAAGRD